jgi:endonuclease G
MQVSLKELDASTKRYTDWKAREKKSPELESVIPKAKNAIPPRENLNNRKRVLRNAGLEPLDFAFERAIGKNDSVYSNFIDILTEAKSKVGRIVLKEGASVLGFATGFMVSERLMLTNWHVFNTKEHIRDSEIQFNYEFDASGRPKAPLIFALAPDDFFFSNQELDYCLVAVQPMDVLGLSALSSIGYHFLNPVSGKLAGEGQEFVNIIHHPDGDFMQLSIRENRFIKIMDQTLWYEADTSQGSSGSPVFNDQFQVVALHHMGVAKRSEDGKHYLDIDGKIIEPKNGKIDVSRIKWIANEGIRISKLTEHLAKTFPDDPMIKGMQVAASTPGFQVQSAETEPLPSLPNHRETIQISIPTSSLQANGFVQVSVQTRPGGNASGMPLIGTNNSSLNSELELEIQRASIEASMNFDGCKGYDPNFMGVKLPMPQPSKSMAPFAAKLKASTATELKYYHYSVIQHAIRKMPMVSAINVDGTAALRQDDSSREDNWLRDNRIDQEAQLNEKFYTKSGFDRGHMSRREDANWGLTAEDAKKFADLTCMHTNACPQAPKLNRSTSRGLWGKLEKVILEQGVEKENNAAAKIAVFNGPIFFDNDPVFRGVQIPLEFWKLVVWRNEKNKLKATAFKLSQANVVGDIDFEALDFDKDMAFQEFQCSIQSRSELTQLDFKAFLKYDTFKIKSGKNEVKVDSKEALLEMLKA